MTDGDSARPVRSIVKGTNRTSRPPSRSARRGSTFESLENRLCFSGYYTQNVPSATLQPSAVSAGDSFGRTVAAMGTDVIGGSFTHTVNGYTAAGEAWQMHTDGTQVNAFFKSPGKANDYNAIAFAANGTDLVMGAYIGSDGAMNSGSAALYSGTTGNQSVIYHPSAPIASAMFGAAVATQGNYVLIGAPNDSTVGNTAGAAYLYDKSTGTPLAKYYPPTATAAGQFGGAVGFLANGNVVIGCAKDSTTVSTSGAVYVMSGTATGTDRTALYKLQEPTPAAAQLFGKSLATTGNTVIIGAPGETYGGKAYGAAYAFDGSTGLETQRFVDAAPVANEQFGYSVAASSDGRVLVGAPLRSGTTASSYGGAMIFSQSSGTMTHLLINPNLVTGESFGNSVAFVGNKVAIGVPFHKVGSMANAGTVYVFTPSDAAPVANAGSNQSTDQNVAVTLNGAASTDPDGNDDIVSYAWDLTGSGTFNTVGEAVPFSATTPGTYPVTLKVTDRGGLSSTSTVNITVNAPTVQVNGATSGSVGTAYNFAGTWSSASKVSWAFGDGNGIAWHSATDPNANLATYAFNSTGTYTVTLSIDDGAGDITTSTMQIVIS